MSALPHPLLPESIRTVLQEVQTLTIADTVIDELVHLLSPCITQIFELPYDQLESSLKSIIPGELGTHAYYVMTKKRGESMSLDLSTRQQNEYYAIGSYLTSEILELSGNVAIDRGAESIAIEDLYIGIFDDSELRYLIFGICPREVYPVQHVDLIKELMGSYVSVSREDLFGTTERNRNHDGLFPIIISYLVKFKPGTEWLDIMPNVILEEPDRITRIIKQVCGLIVGHLQYHQLDFNIINVMDAITHNSYYDLKALLQ